MSDSKDFILSCLSYSDAMMFSYEDTSSIIPVKKHKYIVKARYKGFDIILSFTKLQLKKYGYWTEYGNGVYDKDIVDKKNHIEYTFKLDGSAFNVVIPKSVFNTRICENNFYILNLLEDNLSQSSHKEISNGTHLCVFVKTILCFGEMFKVFRSYQSDLYYYYIKEKNNDITSYAFNIPFLITNRELKHCIMFNKLIFRLLNKKKQFKLFC